MIYPVPPSSGYRWLTPGVLLAPAFVLGGAVLRGSLLLTSRFTGRALPASLWGSGTVWGTELAALVVGALLAVWAMQGATRGWVALRAVAGGLVAGLLEVFLVTVWRPLSPAPAAAGWQGASSLALADGGAHLAYWSVPLGVALGLSSLALVLPAAEAAKRASLDGVDNAAAPAGAWLLASGAIGLWLLRLTPLAPLAGLAVALGALYLLAAQVRAEERVGWLRRVQAGLDPNVAVDERASTLAGVRPLVSEVDASGVGRSGVAMHRAPSRGKVYRAGEGAGTPLARVPLDGRPLRTAWGLRLDAEGRGSFAQLALGLGATLGLGLAAALVPFAVALALRSLPR